MISDNDEGLTQQEETKPRYSLMFVYGSLKRGFGLHNHLRDQQFLGEACTLPLYRLFNCGTYPGMVKVATRGVSVKGEVYGVDPDCRSQLDEAEGVDEGLFCCDAVELEDPFANRPVLAYFYLMSTAQLRDCGRSWPAG